MGNGFRGLKSKKIRYDLASMLAFGYKNYQTNLRYLGALAESEKDGEPRNQVPEEGL